MGAIEAFPDFGHTMPDWDRVLTLGLSGIRDEANEKLKGSADDCKRAFYSSVADTYDGIIGYAKRLADAADASGSVNSRFAAENLRNIAERAPRTLGEAMQLYFVYYAAQHFADGAVLRSLGAVDSLLYPFYKNDIENGKDEGYIRELIRYFLFKWNSMRVEANIPLDLGQEPNRLTYLIAEEYIGLGVHDPKIHFIIKENTPVDLIEMLLRSIRDGKNSIVFISDKAVRASLCGIGISSEDAKRYTLIGCYEPSAIGTELPCTLNGRINLPMALESILSDLCSEGRADAIEYSELISRLCSRILEYIDIAADEINTVEEKYPCFISLYLTPVKSGTSFTKNFLSISKKITSHLF
jgi:formate C-acetyltransferase